MTFPAPPLGAVHLSNLIPHWKIWIEIMFTIEPAYMGHVCVQSFGGFNSQRYGFLFKKW